MAADAVSEDAPAKINLCLHVTGRRTDGYHLLDSLVVFAGVGDRVTVAGHRGITPEGAAVDMPGLMTAAFRKDGSDQGADRGRVLAIGLGAAAGSGLRLGISGPEAHALVPDADNLVLRAAQAMGLADGGLSLWKALPVASGIGGGSADAAATLRAIARWTGLPLPPAEKVLALGADVPVCLAGRPARMQGVGEVLSPLPPLPALWFVLVNPRVPLPTPPVFAALQSRENPPVPDLPVAALSSAADFAAWLTAATRNDLVPPALTVAPVLVDVQTALSATPGCLLARMSGSGGTHFGLYATEAAADAASRHLRTAHPDWWIAEAPLLS